VASRLHRTVLENFSFHEPIYFIYGPDEPVAKFQISFRYRLAGSRESAVASDPAAKGLYLAYTQRSLWNIKEPSSPFYDSSYMPELFFESLAPDRPERQRLVNFLGYQTGYRHESNGKDGLDSRSLDIVYLRSGVLIGRRNGWRAVIVPRLFAYVGKSADNDDIEDYRGFGELLLSIGREDGIQVNVTGMAGRDWNKGSMQVDATYPIKIPAVHFDTFLHVQYFDGYGESLRDYNRKSSTWRAGISLVR
jgi:outer membrane phospholipase A